MGHMVLRPAAAEYLRMFDDTSRVHDAILADFKAGTKAQDYAALPSRYATKATTFGTRSSPAGAQSTTIRSWRCARDEIWEFGEAVP